ncbi:MAG TPA: di-heme oxidoredictase family protein [Verrucomicrobiae bacterium]|nr:di-heme oxidoredictase family protein [Verrucomicrobiae bacterium]
MGVSKRFVQGCVYLFVSGACALLMSGGIGANAGNAFGFTGSAPSSFIASAQESDSNSQPSPAATASSTSNQNTSAQDPGARTDSADAGAPLSTMSADELEYFQDGLSRFIEVDSVTGAAPGESGSGLGPTFNSNSCGSCHSQPAVGGSSPSVNPQIAAATDYGASNSIPFFITEHGPVREARFPFLVTSSGTVSKTPDGGVHDLFTITGRSDAVGCTATQPNFEQMQQLNNLIFRIPTPLFGAGLIENIPEAAIYANMAANATLKQNLGISGHPNISGNDGTITRFGWKAQNKSVEMFAGEAYNVEMGVTNELFPEERSRPPASCMTNPTPEDSTNFPASGAAIPSDIVAFSNFIRFLAPPVQSAKGIPGNPTATSISNGRSLFSQIHCDLCHTSAMQTSASSFAPALSNQTAALFSDLLVHHMGSGLADNVSQGTAGPDEFRTAPLWGLGQRLFFLHDGRATPSNGGLLTAIQAHASSGSEANGVISLFQQLSNQQKQDLMNFLRSL